MRRHHQVRNHVSDSVEYGFDRLHQIADRCLVIPLAAVEGAIEGAARGVHNIMVNHKHHLDRAAIDGSDPAAGRSKRKTKTKPPGSSAYGYGQPGLGPPLYEFYGYPPPPTPAAPPPPTPPPPVAPPLFQYHQAFPVPCRPPH